MNTAVRFKAAIAAVSVMVVGTAIGEPPSASVFSDACGFDGTKAPRVFEFSDESITSTEGNGIELYIDPQTKDSILAAMIYGEMGKTAYKFIFNKTLKDAERTDCGYAEPFGETVSVEKTTLKTSKEAEKHLNGMFSDTRKAMYNALRESAINGNKDVSAYVSSGMKYLDSGDNNRKASHYDLAIAEFDKAIRLDNGNAEAYYGRGRAYLRKGYNMRAAADYSQAIRLNPKDAVSYSNRGCAYARLGNYDQAVADFESARRIDPNNETIKQNLEKARRRDKGL